MTSATVNGKATDDALKLIVKISEGSVRDALSLLDRGLLSLEKNKELDFIEVIENLNQIKNTTIYLTK